MREVLIPALFLFFFLSTPILLAQEKTPDRYGISKKHPILVGGENLQMGPANQRSYLNRLTGPNGEKVSYTRIGSCCDFKTPNGILGGGMLDMYEVTHNGLKKPVVLYLNMYDPNPGEPKIPKGFILAQD